MCTVQFEFSNFEIFLRTVPYFFHFSTFSFISLFLFCTVPYGTVHSLSHTIFFMESSSSGNTYLHTYVYHFYLTIFYSWIKLSTKLQIYVLVRKYCNRYCMRLFFSLVINRYRTATSTEFFKLFIRYRTAHKCFPLQDYVYVRTLESAKQIMSFIRTVHAYVHTYKCQI